MFHNIKRRIIMKILIGMILLMIVGVYGCAVDDSTTEEVEIGDVTVEDTEETPESDLEETLDSDQDVLIVEEEN
tara:strand:- start:171 stop:392 length:222 start_codon:yes stop_codon:yes gene_type:complete